MKELLFLTTLNLSTNPRLTKELQLLSPEIKCTLVCFNFGDWTVESDLSIGSDIVNFRCIILNATRKPIWPWIYYNLLHRIYYWLGGTFIRNIRFQAYASHKRSIQLDHGINRLNSTFDHVIAHNLGALYPAFRYARKNGIRFSFDLEDYHPGESVRDKNEIPRRLFLLKKILPEAQFTTYASPLIGLTMLKELNPEQKSKFHLVRNTFYSSDFVRPEKISGKVRFVWFSQNITTGRGLEYILPVLELYSDSIELHIIGKKKYAKTDLALEKPHIEIHPPMVPGQLHSLLSKMDIGLAIEESKVDMNKDICLSNKLFAYIQAGLYVILSNTSGQTDFITHYPRYGIGVDLEYGKLADCIDKVMRYIEDIRSDKLSRWEKAKEFDYLNEASELKMLLKNEI